MPSVALNGTNGVNGATNAPPPKGAKPNIAIYTNAKHELFQREIPYPEIGPNDCLVQVRCTGICASDVHFWRSGCIGDMIVREDMILGHESAGEVLAVGANVTTIKPGQRVAIEPGVPCAACKHCVGGRYNLCPEVKFAATPPTDGTLRRYMAHPAKYLFPIPDHMTYTQAALVEPFSVALAAVDKCNPRVGQPVFIAGAGPVGLATALCVRAAGASPLVISDLEESRLEQARRLGFNALKIELNWTRDEVAHKIREAMGERCAPEIVFECTGAQTSIQSAIYARQDGGTVVQVGCSKPDVEIPYAAMAFREVNIVTLSLPQYVGEDGPPPQRPLLWRRRPPCDAHLPARARRGCVQAVAGPQRECDQGADRGRIV
ncbi:chaperonin 10-like protein, partial [Schizophyllum commune]